MMTFLSHSLSGEAVPSNVIVESIRLKLREQIDKSERLIRLIPPEHLRWHPTVSSPAMDVGHLLGHLLDCLAGFCAVFEAALPGRVAGIEQLRSQPVNHFCTPEEALGRIDGYMAAIHRGFDLCSDDDLSRILPTVFGTTEPLARLLLGNLEHVVNHKHQLFIYLKFLGVPVATRDLYQFRGEGAAAASGAPF